jgi:hypothetical protein
MPNAPLRFCAAQGCPKKVTHGRCPAHHKAQNTRPSATRRGYTSQWERFRTIHYPQLLLDAGKIPACGASMAGQHAAWSQCVREGVVTMSSLELDHEPPLTAEERLQPHVVLDPMRVGFLCHRDHSAKTRKQQAK